MFKVFFILKVVFIFELVFILEVVFIFNIVLIFNVVLISILVFSCCLNFFWLPHKRLSGFTLNGGIFHSTATDKSQLIIVLFCLAIVRHNRIAQVVE